MEILGVDIGGSGIKGAIVDTETGYRDQLIEDFNKDFGEWINLSTSLVAQYGGTKIGESGEGGKVGKEGSFISNLRAIFNA